MSGPDRFASWLLERDPQLEIETASTAEEAKRYMGWAEVLLAWQLPGTLYQEAGRLKWIQAMGAGVDDIVASPHLPPDVMITRIVGQFGGLISEYVFAELLYRAKGLASLRRFQEERTWKRIETSTLEGRVMGVAGLGSIGKEVVTKARAFRMRVFGLSRTGANAALVDRHFSIDMIGDFVRQVDVLVLTLPLTPQTQGVIDGDLLALMRRDALVVNVGRGDVLVEKDLIAALKNGRLGGAILDVFGTEPLPATSPLWRLPGVTVTPHISGVSMIDGVGSFFLENLRRYRAGEALKGLVDRNFGY